MILAEARAFNDGLDFYVNNKNITVSARRKQNGEIIITKQNSIAPIKEKANPIFLLIISIIFTFIFEYFEKWNIDFFLILICFWALTLFHYILESKNQNNESSLRYHAAEHKMLNYWDKYAELPESHKELLKMPSISIRCGSTIIAVVLVFVTLITLGFSFIPWLIVKILWCIASGFITLYLWANGKCDFFQKMVLKTPSEDEIEVAFLGFG